ncbi:MAG TPA: cupin domain-containing protein [Thermoanaerobaculia bacterium]|nr:cupin domain-containing protein [Thermoanaerobaculia bacterium]
MRNVACGPETSEITGVKRESPSGVTIEDHPLAHTRISRRVSRKGRDTLTGVSIESTSTDGGERMSASRNRSATAWFVLTVTLIWTLPGSNLPALAQSTGAETTSGNAGLILQADEGERRVRRTGDFPFILKVDKQNGGSTDFVMGMEDVKAGQTIPPHRHLHAAEIVFVHKGSALVTLGGREALVREGGTVYIPKNVRIALKNPGPERLTIVFIFPKPGFEEYLRDTSVPEGQSMPPMSPEMRAKIREKHEWHTIYEQR